MATDLINDLEDKIEKEIEHVNEKIEKYNIERFELERQIKRYTNWSWIFIYNGFGLIGFGLIIFFCSGNDFARLNLLGDFYGGAVASVWSLAGLFIIYVAFLGQKQQMLNQQTEIYLSRIEVKYTRLELSGQRAEMKNQNESLKLQRFENTFFQLMKNHQEIVNGIDIRRNIDSDGGPSLLAQGRDCFRTFFNIYKNKLEANPNLQVSLNIFHNFYTNYQADLGHYFRNLFHIIKFIDESEVITQNDKYKKVRLVRALLSSYELTLLFYNGLGEKGKTQFKPLIEKYSLFKNIDDKLLVSHKHMIGYNEIAFASAERRNELLEIENSKLHSSSKNSDGDDAL